MSTQHHRLGELQLRILEILWRTPGASVAEVHAILLTERGLAHTTVATMLRKMEDRGLVSHRADGRSFRYHADVAADAVSQDVANHLVGRLFEGSLADAVSHLLQTRPVSRLELDQLERLIKDAKRRVK